jgi:hypothetical protein
MYLATGKSRLLHIDPTEGIVSSDASYDVSL